MPLKSSFCENPILWWKSDFCGRIIIVEARLRFKNIFMWKNTQNNSYIQNVKVNRLLSVQFHKLLWQKWGKYTKNCSHQPANQTHQSPCNSELQAWIDTKKLLLERAHWKVIVYVILTKKHSPLTRHITFNGFFDFHFDSQTMKKGWLKKKLVIYIYI